MYPNFWSVVNSLAASAAPAGYAGSLAANALPADCAGSSAVYVALAVPFPDAGLAAAVYAVGAPLGAVLAIHCLPWQGSCAAPAAGPPAAGVLALPVRSADHSHGWLWPVWQASSGDRYLHSSPGFSRSCCR